MGRGERGTEKAETLALDINYTERKTELTVIRLIEKHG